MRRRHCFVFVLVERHASYEQRRRPFAVRCMLLHRRFRKHVSNDLVCFEAKVRARSQCVRRYDNHANHSSESASAATTITSASGPTATEPTAACASTASSTTTASTVRQFVHTFRTECVSTLRRLLRHDPVAKLVPCRQLHFARSNVYRRHDARLVHARGSRGVLRR